MGQIKCSTASLDMILFCILYYHHRRNSEGEDFCSQGGRDLRGMRVTGLISSAQAQQVMQKTMKNRNRGEMG